MNACELKQYKLDSCIFIGRKFIVIAWVGDFPFYFLKE